MHDKPKEYIKPGMNKKRFKKLVSLFVESAKRKSIHITYNSSSGKKWVVRKSGNARSTAVFDRRKRAYYFAKLISNIFMSIKKTGHYYLSTAQKPWKKIENF